MGRILGKVDTQHKKIPKEVHRTSQFNMGRAKHFDC